MENSFQIDRDLYLLKHPFYQDWMEGRLSRGALQDYACQYYHHVGAFPGYIQNALGVCENSQARAILQENLAEEDGTAYGTSHPELWLRFAEGTGMSREQVFAASARDAIQNVVFGFHDLTGSSYAQGLGALFAYESQVPEIAQSKIEGLKKHFDICDERSLSFFEVHKVADIDHREKILSLIEALPDDERETAKESADRICQLLWDFLSDVHAQSACA